MTPRAIALTMDAVGAIVIIVVLVQWWMEARHDGRWF